MVKYRIVHLAAHGRYDPDPMKSGVIVSDVISITPPKFSDYRWFPNWFF